MALLQFRTEMSREYWDELTTREQLYAVFDKMPDHQRETFSQDPEQPVFYKDADFAKVGKKLKAAAETLIPILRDIAAHLPEQTFLPNIGFQNVSTKLLAEELLSKLDLSKPGSQAVMVWLLMSALDPVAAGSITNRITTGDGIPEARAAYRAYQRYLAFKKKDADRLEAFKETQEYKTQMLEIRLGLRTSISVPEPGEAIKNAFYTESPDKIL